MDIDSDFFFSHISAVVFVFQAADSPQVLSEPMMTWVKKGGTVRLDKKHLHANVQGVGSEHIVYNIFTADGGPQYGTGSQGPSRMQSTFCVPDRLICVLVLFLVTTPLLIREHIALNYSCKNKIHFN